MNNGTGKDSVKTDGTYFPPYIYNVCAVESAEVIGGDDCIIIRGVADARVTIVSMDGRSQQQMVNGDTGINVRAGVYGVILEQGKAVIREKIVVR